MNSEKMGKIWLFWSTILAGLRALSKWLVASHLQARVFLPRLEYLGSGPPQGSRPTRARQLRTERVVTFLIPNHQFCNSAPLNLEGGLFKIFWWNNDQSSLYDDAQPTGLLLNISCCLFRVSYNFALISKEGLFRGFQTFCLIVRAGAAND